MMEPHHEQLFNEILKSHGIQNDLGLISFISGMSRIRKFPTLPLSYHQSLADNTIGIMATVDFVHRNHLLEPWATFQWSESVKSAVLYHNMSFVFFGDVTSFHNNEQNRMRSIIYEGLVCRFNGRILTLEMERIRKQISLAHDIMVLKSDPNYSLPETSKIIKSYCQKLVEGLEKVRDSSFHKLMSFGSNEN